MKLKLFYTLLSLALIAFLMQSRSGGPAKFLNQDLSGSPVNGNAYCINCHSAGNFSPNMLIEVLDNGNLIDEYEPGESYDLKISVEATSGNPGGYGFQTVALKDNDNSNAGTFGSTPNGTHITNLSGRDYFEHSSRQSTNSWTIEWTAPEAGTGDVRIYAAGIAADANGSTSGDGAATNSLTLQEAVSTSTKNTLAGLDQFEVLGNPVINDIVVKIASENINSAEIFLSDLNGKQIWSSMENIGSLNENYIIPASNLTPGLFLLGIKSAEGISTKKIIKI